MPFDAGIEAAGAAVVETQPIPGDKNAGEEKHPCRRGNGTPFQQLAKTLPSRHGLGSAD
jgi:hypothetical protein